MMCMKKFTDNPWRLLALISTSVYVIFWALWYFCYKYVLIWLEGYSYFSTLPDYWELCKSLPSGFLIYVGSFLHQFYLMPAVGAAIQALFDLWPVLCTGIMVIRLTKDPGRFLWISLIPLPFFAYQQFWDLNLLLALKWFIVFTSAMLVVILVTSFRLLGIVIPRWICNTAFSITISVAALGLSIYFLVGFDPRTREHEERACLEFLGERHLWDDILERVSPQEARSDEFKKRYALLALTEKGILSDYAFRYGLAGSDDFFFSETIEPMSLNFNALLYQCLGMHNASIHQSYQFGVQSVSGVGFASLRRMADLYIDLKDYRLAKKYVDVLSHSSCYRSWVNERISKLEAIKDSVPSYSDPTYAATIANFTHTISSMVDRNRGNRKYTDLLLCSLLADEEGDKFKKIFSYVAQVQYPSGKDLPRLYEEALILIAMVDPDILAAYSISEDTQRRFADYVNMMNAGRGTQALRKHADTYWAYSY